MRAVEYKAYYESEEFKNNYIYEGKDLGAVCKDGTLCVKLWSPMADQVILHLYRTGESGELASFGMKRKEKGIWEYKVSGYGHGTYYDFTVQYGKENVRTADPWAKACSCNGERSMVVDLSRTNPDGWKKDCFTETAQEQIIYEVHVKDFSCDQTSGVPEEYRGKYKAFTVEGTTVEGNESEPTCLDYLTTLGITHVQLMPVYDYGSVDEAGNNQQYNWGYDPKNYNIPEGSYATDPYNGEVRIREFKEMVMALHRKGIGVIMDVVYNHTYSIDSWFSRTAPYYFYRQFPDGNYSNGSDCGNDVASEREMCRKYILESVLYWTEEYHIDGYRFDLMGLLDVGLLNKIRKELDERYGKGKILLYGEPWSARETAMEKGHIPCLKENVHLLDENIGVFCDNIRDAVKGHVFYEEVPGFVNGGKDCEKAILCSIDAWADKDATFRVKAPSQVITYVSAHDNLTLWDKLMITMKPGKDFRIRDEEVVRAYKMAAAIYFTCQGRIFFLAGEECARTKNGDENSYSSAVEINRLDWRRTYEFRDILEYYQGLIEFRKQMEGLCDKSANAKKHIREQKNQKEGVIEFLVENGAKNRWTTLAICYNSTEDPYEMTLPEGSWELLIDETESWKWKVPIQAEKNPIAAPVSVRVYGKKR